MTTTALHNPAARRKITAARTTLVLDEPFFGTLALKLKLVEEEDCDCPNLKECPHTAWVDGTSLGYFPRFVMSLTEREVSALIVHEVMHCAAGHPWRRGGRDPRKANEAMDRAINPILREAGYKLPEGALFEIDPTHHGKSFEWIYDRLPRPEEEEQAQGAGGSGTGSGSSHAAPQRGPIDQPSPDQSGQGKGSKQAPEPGPQNRAGNDPGLTQDRDKGRNEGSTGARPKDHKHDALGEVRDAPTEGADPDEKPATEAEWQQSVQQAAALAQGQGTMPGSLKRFAKVAADSRIDWRSAMRRFAQEVARADYSFARPNSRYVGHGMYLPSLRNQEVGVLAVAVDTSGSVDQVLLDQFANEIRAVADEVKPREIRVLYADAKVQGEDRFERDDTIELHANGGGGTDFRPVFNHIEGWDEPPVAVIYLTDLMGTFPDEEPHVPTLWVTGSEDPRPVPFGEVVTAAF